MGPTVTNLKAFDCPICSKSLQIPIFQCDNGHIACSSCCAKVENKCPFCSWSIGYIRCRGMEKVLESVKVSCQNSQYGCRERLSYCKKDDHIEKCPYAPCSCPLPDCNFLGSVKQFSHHFLYKHSICHIGFQYSCLFPISLEKTDKFFLLREETEGALFILSNSIIERHGNTLAVNCIGPRSSKRGFSYDLIAKKGGSSLRLQCVTEGNSGQAKSPPTGFLLVPNDFFGISGMLKMDVCIRTNVLCPSSS